jgi:hypothetical protein
MDFEMIEMSRKIAETKVESAPVFRAMVLLADEWRKYNLPLKYIGRVNIDVNDNFFADKDEAREVIYNYTICIKNIYDKIAEEFGEVDALSIFGDFVSKFSIEYTK